VGSDTGLGLIDEIDKSIKYYDERHGLSNINVVEILEKGDYLWIFTFQGIFRFDPIRETFESYSQLDGIGKLRNAVDQDAIKDKKGNFWILGEKGLFTFHPDNLFPDPKPPQIIINDLKINNQSIFTTFKTNTTNTLGLLKFPYFENNIAIDFVGIHLDNSKQNTYQYILEGHQKNWQNVGNDRTARFSNLPPGNYTFKVKAALK